MWLERKKHSRKSILVDAVHAFETVKYTEVGSLCEASILITIAAASLVLIAFALESRKLSQKHETLEVKQEMMIFAKKGKLR